MGYSAPKCLARKTYLCEKEARSTGGEGGAGYRPQP